MNNHKRDGLINLFISYSGVLLAFGITILKARALTTEQIGLISIIVTISFLASFSSNMGYHYIIKKYYFFYENDKAKQNTLVFLVFFVTLVNIFVVFFLLLWKKDFIVSKYENDLFESYYRYVFVIVFFEAINQLLMSLYQISGKSIASNLIYDFFFKFSGFVLLIVYSLLNITFSVYLTSYILLYVMRTVLFLIFSLPGKHNMGFDFSIVSILKITKAVKYAFLMFFSSFAGMLTKTIDKLMLGSMADLDVVGIYTIILTFPILIQSIGSAFGFTGHAKVSELIYRNDKEGLKKIYTDNVNILVFLGLFVFGIFIVFGRPILFFFNEKLVSAYWATIFLMFGELISVSTGLGGWILSFSKKYYYETVTRFFLIIITIVTNYLLIPILGLNGAALATTISLILYNSIKILILKNTMDLFPYTNEILKKIILFLILFSASFYMQKSQSFENIIAVILISLFLFVLYIVLGKYIFKLKLLKDLKKILK